MSSRATVRILFHHATQYGWVTERHGDFAGCDVTGGFVPLEVAEDLAALYAAARGLSVSRVDMP